jgi:hypothetical protein
MEPKMRAVDAHKGAWRLKMELRRVCRSMVADSHHFDHEHKSEALSGSDLK